MKGSEKTFTDKMQDLRAQYDKGVAEALDEEKAKYAPRATGGAPMASSRSAKVKVAKAVKVAKGKKAAKIISKAGGQTTLYEFIKANPGARSEQMPYFGGKAVALKALLASGYLRCTGRARGTSYTVTKKTFE